MFEPHDWRTTMPIKPTPSSLRSTAGTSSTTMGRASARSARTWPHAKWWSPLGPEGVSPAPQLGTTLHRGRGDALPAAQFRNGARPPSAIEAPRRSSWGWTRRPATRCSSSCARTSRGCTPGRRTRGRPALLPPGLEWKPVGHTSRRGGADRAAVHRRRGGRRGLPDPASVPRRSPAGDVLEHRRAPAGGLHGRARAAAGDHRAGPDRACSRSSSARRRVRRVRLRGRAPRRLPEGDQRAPRRDRRRA
jgi:hypothetical protein